ncbi:hypothetical protein ATN84_16975 [Paramesorhizobium deserti]|uniref:PepSY domain-containing protein n=2 Tax=Paramesorhizobium deserti TaxID=1494590 RepID=A0A135HR58_9HYPH|nr:hypothetical protein ATN84_16975 [Paramesorhizobium deserti]
MYVLRLPLIALFLASVLLVGWMTAHADEDLRPPKEKLEGADLDRIRSLVQQGKLLSLATLKADILKRWPGELIGVTVDQEHGNIVYEFRILRPTGQMTEVEVDAATGKLVEIENE